MASTFYGLNIASSGLSVSQRQINLTGHNIANANTLGYTRQRLTTSAIAPPGANSKWLPGERAAVGGGVTPQSLDQIRDKFLDRQIRNENGRAQYWDTKYNTLYYVEDVFNNMDTSNLNKLMNNVFDAFQEFSTNSTDSAVRREVIEKAQAMVETFHIYYNQMKDIMGQQDEMLVAQSKRINDIAKEMAELNTAIFKYEISGENANDLRDRRNLLLDELSGIADISYKEVPTGKTDINGKEMYTLQVSLGSNKDEKGNPINNILVDHKDYNALTVTTKPAGYPALDNVSVIQINGSDLNLSSGIMKSLTDMRDGNKSDNQGIPYFISQLDTLAAAMVKSVNDIHTAGYTMPYTDEHGVFHESTKGINFFDPAGTTLATISLSKEIKDNVNNLAGSSAQVTLKPGTQDLETGNNEIAKKLAALKQATGLGGVGNFEKYYNTFITGLASEVSYASKTSDLEAALVMGLEEQRTSVSGVSVDEEMTHLVRFQHAYNAAARVLTSMDEALDVLINRTGRVGL